MAIHTGFRASLRGLLASVATLVLLTASQASWAAVGQKSDATSPNPKSLLISVRYGEGDTEATTFISSRDNNSEQSVQVLEGERASVAMRDGPPGRDGQTGARAATQSMLELVAKVSGNKALVQFFSQTQSQSSSANQGNRVASTLSVPLGAWTEVSARSAWRGSSNSTLSSASARGDGSRVYLRIDVIGQ